MKTPVLSQEQLASVRKYDYHNKLAKAMKGNKQ